MAASTGVLVLQEVQHLSRYRAMAFLGITWEMHVLSTQASLYLTL
jgi:hypothetical protein